MERTIGEISARLVARGWPRVGPDEIWDDVTMDLDNGRWAIEPYEQDGVTSDRLVIDMGGIGCGRIAITRCSCCERLSQTQFFDHGEFVGGCRGCPGLELAVEMAHIIGTSLLVANWPLERTWPPFSDDNAQEAQP